MPKPPAEPGFWVFSPACFLHANPGIRAREINSPFRGLLPPIPLVKSENGSSKTQAVGVCKPGGRASVARAHPGLTDSWQFRRARLRTLRVQQEGGATLGFGSCLGSDANCARAAIVGSKSSRNPALLLVVPRDNQLDIDLPGKPGYASDGDAAYRSRQDQEGQVRGLGGTLLA